MPRGHLASLKSSELKEFLFFLVPTAAAFAIMLQIWITHFTFFRRYGVADKKIVVLNAALIFFVLYLAYPLRFTFSALYNWVIGLSTGDYKRGIEMEMTTETGALTICFFVVAYACCLALLGLMYGHVIKKREILDLNDNELATTRTTLRVCGGLS